MPYEALKDIEILFGLALITVVLFRRLMFQSIIGFLVTGILAGPYALAFIQDTNQVEQMAEIGVVLLLFTIGIELSLKELMRIKHLVLWGGGLQVFVTILAVTAVGAAFGYPVNQAAFFGFLVALSSTAILMKLLIDSGQADSPHGKMAMGILIFQDLCIVPMMLATPLLAGEGDGIQGILIITGKAVAVVLAAHYGARFFVPFGDVRAIGRSRQTVRTGQGTQRVKLDYNKFSEKENTHEQQRRVHKQDESKTGRVERRYRPVIGQGE
jgi:CPA2 family monovalent cation:H+ antiporter-2